MKISGVIQSGAGKGAFFTQVDWVVEQCNKMLGYRPFPGTLNLRINDSDLESVSLLSAKPDFELVPDDPAFCSAQVKKVVINDIAAAVVLPDEEVRIHEKCVLEVISNCSLKQTLGLADGDTVSLSWDEASDPDKNPTNEKINGEMGLYREIYEFAASAGALEGFVYPRKKLEANQLDNWIKNLGKQYHELPEDARKSFQSALDRTLGRAVHALIPVLGAGHDHIKALKAIIAGEIPVSHHDFELEKKDKATKYGA